MFDSGQKATIYQIFIFLKAIVFLRRRNKEKSMQKQAVRVDRITLIYDDNTTREIYGGHVRVANDGSKRVLVESQYVPREHLGMELVAAHSDGSVEASFEVDDMWMESGTRVWSPKSRTF